jgi:hypothetical protein
MALRPWRYGPRTGRATGFIAQKMHAMPNYPPAANVLQGLHAGTLLLDAGNPCTHASRGRRQSDDHETVPVRKADLKIRLIAAISAEAVSPEEIQ